ncbi:MAG: hypothetical protein HY079_10540 [Elusimicrobia bacterium]|nr:hypothetical protein [Elusimicrobiota bacterium]
MATGRWARLLVLAAFVGSLGLPAAFLQACAWTRMAVEYARRDGVASALAETFDGAHPCAMCLVLRDADTAPHSLSAAPAHARVAHAAPTAAPSVRLAGSAAAVVETADAPRARARRVDTPPPEAALS